MSIMSAYSEIDVQRLFDRIAIADCLVRYCRGIDREDLDLIRPRLSTRTLLRITARSVVGVPILQPGWIE